MMALSHPDECLTEGEIEEIFLPLMLLIKTRVEAAEDLRRRTEAFGERPETRPFIIGICGSVAVGKSTFARALRAVLVRSPQQLRVELVPTDGFLHSNAELQRRDLMQRKGFPESYDTQMLIEFLTKIKYGESSASAPVYSHEKYDIVPGEYIDVSRPDILIIEGLNILQVHNAPALVSDFIDFSIYVDAEIEFIEEWYITRFLRLKETAFKKTSSFFHHFSDLDEEGARSLAKKFWNEINKPNLLDNISPTRERADAVLRKGPDHQTEDIWIRRN